MKRGTYSRFSQWAALTHQVGCPVGLGGSQLCVTLTLWWLDFREYDISRPGLGLK